MRASSIKAVAGKHLRLKIGIPVVKGKEKRSAPGISLNGNVWKSAIQAKMLPTVRLPADSFISKAGKSGEKIKSRRGLTCGFLFSILLLDELYDFREYFRFVLGEIGEYFPVQLYFFRL